MPNCNFYALKEDIADVLDFVFSQPGWVALEDASRPDHKLREFHGAAEVANAFALGSEDVFLMLYAPEMRGGEIRRRRITFKKGAVPGATHRYEPLGWGLIQLFFFPLRNGRLGCSFTNHNSERRALKWESTYADELGPVHYWDWAAVTRASSRLCRHIRRIAVAKENARAILPAAFSAREKGSLVFTQFS